MASAAMSAPARPQGRLTLNDASRLNPTPVAKHVIVGPDAEAGLVARLRAELREARIAGRPVALGAARHSMGGQSLALDGAAITFETRGCDVDAAAQTYRAAAGARWREVIAKLDPLGLSPKVMQSNNDFAVASTFAVNAHGWPVPYGPVGSTVRSLRLMLADGALLTCSRTENEELFRLTMGGYGLLGVILDLELEATPNLLLRPIFALMPAVEFGLRFVRAIEASTARMAFGRLSVARRDFLQEAFMVVCGPAANQPAPLPPVSTGGVFASVSRRIYRAQVGSERAKRARWLAETVAAPKALARPATRNRFMNEPVSGLAGSDPRRTDILHEYFVPPERFAEFLTACRDTILPSRQDCLNVTLRYVAADRESVLSYAPEPRIAAVLSFSQEIAPEAEADMKRMTETLIERVIGLGGSFYLPYRLHARRDQVERAYAGSASFVRRKRHHDPGGLFRNAMWDAYFAE